VASETLAVTLLLQANQYKREAASAATATGKISNAAGAAGVATGKLDRQMSGLATTAKFAVAGVATAAVVGFAKDSVRAATDLNESINAVNVVFGEAAEGVLAIGRNSADSFGLANSEFNAFAVQFSNFSQTIAAKSGQDVVSVVEDITTRIADFASVMNIDVPEAAEKFQSGLAGQVEPLRKYGIDVSAAAVNQKALELGLAGSTSELTEQDKVLARYELIMKQTNKTAGDFKNTQGELANATRTASANFEDFKAQVGEELTPVLNEAVKEGTNLLDVFDSDLNLGWTQRLSAGLQTILGDSADSVKAYIEQKEALNDIDDVTGTYLTTLEESIGASNRHRGAVDDTSTALEGATEATEDYGTSVEALKFAEDRQRIATKAARDALLAKRDALREIHNPMFGIVRLNDDLAEAEKAVEKASKKGIASPEYRDAVIDRANVIADLQATMTDLKTKGIDPTGAAARLMFEGLEIPDNVIDAIFAQFDALEADWEGRVFNTTFSLPDFRAQPNGTFTRVGNTIYSQHGGIFNPRPGGRNVTLAEAGSREAVIPLNGEGVGILAAAMREASALRMPSQPSNGAAAGPVYNIFTLTWGDFVQQANKAGVDIQRLGW